MHGYQGVNMHAKPDWRVKKCVLKLVSFDSCFLTQSGDVGRVAAAQRQRCRAAIQIYLPIYFSTPVAVDVCPGRVRGWNKAHSHYF